MDEHIPLDLLDTNRVLAQLNQLAQIGRTAQGSVTRLAFTREDAAARRLFIQWMTEAGLTVYRDPVGNLIGASPRSAPGVPALASGSHIDSVINAGSYDGIVGALAAVERARVLHLAGAGSVPFYVLCFVMEESSRFGAGYGFGSRVMVGAPISDQELTRPDADGITLARAVEQLRVWEAGTTFDGSDDQALSLTRDAISESHFDFSQLRAYVELHIEQGPVLAQANLPLGIVTALAAPTRLAILLTGEQNHSGTTPMSLRRDALAAAAEAVLAVEHLAQALAAQNIVATVGVLRVHPNAVNVIPGSVEMTVDIRGIDAEQKNAFVANLTQTFQSLAARRGTQIAVTTLADEQPVTFAPSVIKAMTTACHTQGFNPLLMHGGAGHDAAHIARVTDAGMLFIPSRGGISHDPREFSAPADIALGIRALLATLLTLSAPST